MPLTRSKQLARSLMLLAIALAAAMPGPARGQAGKAPPPIEPRTIAITPAAAPAAALKYRLFPSSAERNPGNAAPIYLRIRYQTTDALWDQITPNAENWQKVPIDRFPTAEVRKFLDGWHRQLEQLAFGARRSHCDWDYTIPEQRHNIIDVALPDGQGMRQWVRLLSIKARLEIAEGKYDEAVRTIQTGLAFSRHIAEGPFIINGLVGLAGVHVMLDRCEELITRPGAPNLYWALATLPSPVIDSRREIEIERRLFENLIPELEQAESDPPRTAAEWSSILARIHERLVQISRDYREPELKAFAGWDLARFKAESLAPARAYLRSRPDLDDARRAAITDDQAVAMFLAGRHRELWDDLFKAAYLPLREALPQLDAAEQRMQVAGTGALRPFAALHPALGSLFRNHLKVERRVAALRVIEAIRLHAAAHGGALPESLSEITEVPVPDDPATGEPFIYRAADDAGLLHGPRAGLPPPWLSYRIAIRH
ncbi:MAG: hypothetical protein ACYC61_27665 [Isosphaeraceae bacterium]